MFKNHHANPRTCPIKCPYSTRREQHRSHPHQATSPPFCITVSRPKPAGRRRSRQYAVLCAGFQGRLPRPCPNIVSLLFPWISGALRSHQMLCSSLQESRESASPGRMSPVGTSRVVPSRIPLHKMNCVENSGPLANQPSQYTAWALPNKLGRPLVHSKPRSITLS